MLLPLHLNGLNLDSGTAVAVITGTLDGSTEAEIVAGGKTTIITLTNDTWVASGATFNAQRQAIIDGVTSVQTELLGWNNEVRDNEVVGAVSRDSDTQVTILWTAAPAYDITDDTGDETITVTVPAAALTAAAEITGSPTVEIIADTTPAVVPETAGGGWAAQYFYDKYVEQRREREEEREKVRVQVESIEDDTDAQIARLLHKQIEQDARRSELESLEALVKSTYTERQERLALEYNERVAKAYVRAATQANFSAMDAFEREMDRAREEEEFLFLAMTVLQ